MKLDKSFMGYRRENGRVGIRNHVVVMPLDDISNAAAEAVAAHVQGTMAIPHAYGRLQFGEDLYAADIYKADKFKLIEDCRNHQERKPERRADTITLTSAETQSGSNRQRWAETLISKLPDSHDGRNSWLLNYGIGIEAMALRRARDIQFNDDTQAAELRNEGLRRHADIRQEEDNV